MKWLVIVKNRYYEVHACNLQEAQEKFEKTYGKKPDSICEVVLEGEVSELMRGRQSLPSAGLKHYLVQFINDRGNVVKEGIIRAPSSHDAFILLVLDWGIRSGYARIAKVMVSDFVHS